MNYLLSLVELLYLCNYINNYHRLYEAKVFFVYLFNGNSMFLLSSKECYVFSRNRFFN